MKSSLVPSLEIKAIIGLGNPGPAYYKTRHNIGFLIIDELAELYQGVWSIKDNMELCAIVVENRKILLIKPLTFMNNSGHVLSFLYKQGIKQDNILVVHDELELPFGVVKFKFDGSSKGHNGLKSIMACGGSNFLRLRFGIDRPIDRQDVPHYVLAGFKETQFDLQSKIDDAVSFIDSYLKKSKEFF